MLGVKLTEKPKQTNKKNPQNFKVYGSAVLNAFTMSHSIIFWVDKLYSIYIQSNISHKKEWSTDKCQGLGGRRKLLFNCYEVSLWEAEKILQMDGGDDCTTM